MSQNRAVGTGDVAAILTSDGSVVQPDENGDVTLTVATYVFVLGGAESELVSVHIKTGTAIAGTFTIETSNFPKFKGDISGPTVDIADYSTTTGDWIKEDPTTAYVGSTGTGWTITNLTLAKTAGAGGALIHLGNLGCKRTRLKAVITTGGKVRVNRHAKSA